MITGGNRISFAEDEEEYELHKLREAAKIASIYHRNDRKFVRNRKLSHVVHASLNFAQFISMLFIEIFHHVHHYANRRWREKDETIPILHEERNPIFFLYPICMLVSFLYAVLWLLKRLLPERPGIVSGVSISALLGCAFGAISMLVAGIMEMKHTDIYIDINKVTDEELLDHPVFIHNFFMCILSIFVMTIYLVHTWLLFDVWCWVRKYKELPETSPMEYDSEPATSNDTITIARLRMRNLESFSKELPGELDPIPTLDKFPSRATIDRVPMENEPVIFYCCFVDCYNYLKQSRKKRPTHEFQVIHVL